MAGHGDTKVDVKTYDRMISMMKYGGVACFLLAALVIWLIAH
ncbi:aa3-type cytochrome c oxidase subunit IV [Sphingomonas sp. KR1UV-12]|uniref:Aa3-type cytochrome c oxidase subunit IV n=1 Tax=Sphingomonas aurea TaxID=3063994 RepID=A0ABT9EMP5_9SPHN|nr:aa3-type cytochrome c oxidase subunit IV [Sphingomonas sp. KR1UV-12]MDP1028081.1 aa3-type cytochrome c oxidase subunit IV [Sphingomonas sp. KR1UV-12]